jgi:hypothetical protein
MEKATYTGFFSFLLLSAASGEDINGLDAKSRRLSPRLVTQQRPSLRFGWYGVCWSWRRGHYGVLYSLRQVGCVGRFTRD